MLGKTGKNVIGNKVVGTIQLLIRKILHKFEIWRVNIEEYLIPSLIIYIRYWEDGFIYFLGISEGQCFINRYAIHPQGPNISFFFHNWGDRMNDICLEITGSI